MRGRGAAVADEQDRHRMAAYELARWVAFAFHDPKHMPKFEMLVASARAVIATVEERQQLVNDAKVRAWFMARAMKSKKANGHGISDNRVTPGQPRN